MFVSKLWIGTCNCAGSNEDHSHSFVPCYTKLMFENIQPAGLHRGPIRHHHLGLFLSLYFKCTLTKICTAISTCAHTSQNFAASLLHMTCSSILQSDAKWGGLKAGQVMAQPKPVFSRIENQIEDGNAGETVKAGSKDKENINQNKSAIEV